MRPSVKIVLSTFVSLLLLGLVALVSIPFMVDLNDFKAQIEEAVAENTGRELSIEGNIDLSIFPWLGVTTGKMTMKNSAGFAEQPFAQITEGQFKVKLLPLFLKKLEINEIVLKGLNLNLRKNSQGVNNWDDLAALIANKDQSKSPLKLLGIAGILIANAQITWDDQQNGQQLQIKDFNLNSEKLIFNHPIAMGFDLTAYSPEHELTETVEFSGDLTVTEALDIFSFKKINLKTKTEAKFLPTGKLAASATGDVKLDLKHQTLKLAPLHTKVATLTISTSALISWLEQPFNITGLVHIPNFDVAKFMQEQLQIKLPPMIDEKALTWVAADFHLDMDADHAKLQNLELQIDETLVKGNVQISHFSDPIISLKASLDKVNFDRYLPPPEPKENWQNLPVSVAAEKASLFPLEMLRKLNINSHISIDELKVNNMTMQGIKLQFNAKQGEIQSLQSIDRFYQGAYNSKFVLDANRELPVLTLHQQLSKVQIEPLLTDIQGQSQLAGLVDLNAELEAVGNSKFAVKSSLNGRLSFLGKDVSIRGFNLQKIIDNGKILLSNSGESSNSTKKDRTFFSKVTGTAIISNSFLNNNDLVATSNKARLSGMGVINLFSQQLDYKIIAVLMKEKLISTQTKVVNNIPVFINIGGTVAEPAYQVDLAAMGMGL
jgi:AsmA protein